MTDEELNKKMEGVVSKTTPKKRRKKYVNKNPYQLWAQLQEETLRKLGYIK